MRISQAGFTLLEVMVAVAILAVAMVAIFSSEAGAIRLGARARHMTTATLLARCKMGELEEHVIRDGVPAISEDGEDGCCEDHEVEGFSCSWRLERVELPESVNIEDEEGGPSLPGATGAAGAAGAAGAVGAAGSVAAKLGVGGGAASPSSVQDALAGGGGADALTSLALEFTYPLLRPVIENQVRRATVTVSWGEGQAERSFDVVQFLVAEQGPANQDPANLGGIGGNPPQLGATR